MARTIAKDHGQKRISILQSAARLFAQEGFARASMSQVAQECGISKANIYHYYDGKDALLFDILDTYLSALRDRLCTLPLDGMTASEQLHAVVSETLLAYDGMDNEHKIQTEGIALLPAHEQEVLRGYQRDIVDLMGGILRNIAPDVFDNDRAKLRATTMSVFGMLNWFYMWNGNAGKEGREDYADLVSKLTLNGIQAV